MSITGLWPLDVGGFQEATVQKCSVAASQSTVSSLRFTVLDVARLRANTNFIKRALHNIVVC